MAKIDQTELSKLTHDERIKRLEGIKEENKKEIEEAEKLIERLGVELEKEKIAESVKVPEIRPVNVESLFKEEGSLEAVVREEAPPEELREESQLYLLAQAYEELREMYRGEEKISEEQLEWIDKLGERVEKASYETAARELANLAVATRSLIRKIRKYHQQGGGVV